MLKNERQEMKNIITLLLIIAVCYNVKAQQVPNGDFESGADTLSAKDWHTINELTGIFFPFTRTSDAYSGDYAVKLETLEIFNTKVPGIATLANLSIGNVSGSIHFPYKPDKLTGMYKHPNDMDASLIRVYFLKNQEDRVDTIGVGSFVPEGNINEYEKFEVNIAYNSTSSVPDSMNIILISDSDVPNSTLYIDKLEFIYSSNSVDHINDNSIVIYPNPVYSSLSVNIDGLIGKKYIILNLFGEILLSGGLNDSNSINVSGIPTGLYFLVIDNIRSKFIKK
jgi:hypothetical protein